MAWSRVPATVLTTRPGRKHIVNLKQTLSGSAALLAAALTAASVASAAPGSASLVIRHQLHGCHSWSLNGAAFKPSQTLNLGVKGTLTFANNDVMSHRLVEKSGPAVQLKGSATMGRIGATLKVTFPTAGTYVFTTKPGVDYMKGITTIGADNVLKLVVHVS
jgi:plastocyanin